MCVAGAARVGALVAARRTRLSALPFAYPAFGVVAPQPAVAAAGAGRGAALVAQAGAMGTVGVRRREGARRRIMAKMRLICCLLARKQVRWCVGVTACAVAMHGYDCA